MFKYVYKICVFEQNFHKKLITRPNFIAVKDLSLYPDFVSISSVFFWCMHFFEGTTFLANAWLLQKISCLLSSLWIFFLKVFLGYSLFCSTWLFCIFFIFAEKRRFSENRIISKNIYSTTHLGTRCCCIGMSLTGPDIHSTPSHSLKMKKRRRRRSYSSVPNWIRSRAFSRHLAGSDLDKIDEDY